MKKFLAVMVALLVSSTYADVFHTNNPTGTAPISFSMDFVDVGDAGNAATDNTYYMWGGSYWVQAPGYGAVAYDYRISKTEVTVGQVNALFHSLGDSVDLTSTMPQPTSGSINTMHTLMYVNWLNAGAPADGASAMTNGGVYNFTSWGVIEPWAEEDQWDNGDGTKNIWRNKDAKYFMPSFDECFKSANYKGGSTNAGYWLYPTSIDNATGEVPPGTTTYSANYNNVLTGPVEVGSYPDTQSPYGVLDMAGNLWELCEVTGDGTTNPTMPGWGGAYWNNSKYLRYKNTYPYDRTYNDVGFRIAATIPEELLPGDADRDGVVSAGDYASIQANFGNTGLPGLPGDANGDGIVSAEDYASVRANFGNLAPSASVPEPATISLIGLGAVAILRKKNSSQPARTSF